MDPRARGHSWLRSVGALAAGYGTMTVLTWIYGAIQVSIVPDMQVARR